MSDYIRHGRSADDAQLSLVEDDGKPCKAKPAKERNLRPATLADCEPGDVVEVIHRGKLIRVTVGFHHYGGGAHVLEIDEQGRAAHEMTLPGGTPVEGIERLQR